jgi:hypothetical protein
LTSLQPGRGESPIEGVSVSNIKIKTSVKISFIQPYILSCIHAFLPSSYLPTIHKIPLLPTKRTLIISITPIITIPSPSPQRITIHRLESLNFRIQHEMLPVLLFLRAVRRRRRFKFRGVVGRYWYWCRVNGTHCFLCRRRCGCELVEWR